MSIIQVPFEIPPDIKLKLLKGEYRRIGGVIRDKKGKIVYHLIEAGTKKENKLAKAIQKAKMGFISHKSEVIAIGAGIIIIGGTAYTIYRYHKKSKEKKLAEIRVEFEDALHQYIEAASKKSMSLEIIDRLKNSTENIINCSDTKRQNILIPINDYYSLISLICNYANDFVKANNFEINEKANNEPILVNLLEHLDKQRRIFDESA